MVAVLQKSSDKTWPDCQAIQNADTHCHQQEAFSGLFELPHRPFKSDSLTLLTRTKPQTSIANITRATTRTTTLVISVWVLSHARNQQRPSKPSGRSSGRRHVFQICSLVAEFAETSMRSSKLSCVHGSSWQPFYHSRSSTQPSSNCGRRRQDDQPLHHLSDSHGEILRSLHECTFTS